MELSKKKESRQGERHHIFVVFATPCAACPVALSLGLAVLVRNLSDRLRALARMKTKAQRRLAALRAVAEQNEEAAQANTIDAVDNEAIEAVR